MSLVIRSAINEHVSNNYINNSCAETMSNNKLCLFDILRHFALEQTGYCPSLITLVTHLPVYYDLPVHLSTAGSYITYYML